LGLSILSIVNQSTLFPDAEIQAKIAAAYLLIPTALVSVQPILFTHGATGSGKSNLCKIARAVWGVNNMTNASSTGRSMRNDISRDKYNDTGCLFEKVIHGIVIDDAKVDFFTLEPYRYDIFKGGYSRGSDAISVAGEKGENIYFRVFGSRCFSSLTRFDSLPQYSELHRRLLPIACKKQSVAKVVNPDYVNFKGLNYEVVKFWQKHENQATFNQLLQDLHELVAGNGLGMDSHTETISLGLIASLVTTGISESLKDAIELVQQYWVLVESNKVVAESATYRLIREYFVKHIEVIRHLKLLKEKGFLDIYLSEPQIADYLREIGYYLIDGCWEKQTK
jgi:hypothetical protein